MRALTLIADTVEERRIVGIRPKPAFGSMLGIAIHDVAAAQGWEASLAEAVRLPSGRSEGEAMHYKTSESIAPSYTQVIHDGDGEILH